MMNTHHLSSKEELAESLLTPPSADNPDLDSQDVTMDEELRVPQSSWTRGEKQSNSGFRDVLFALLFLLQVAIIAYLAVVYGIPALNYSVPNSSEKIQFSGVLYISLLSGLVSLGLSTVLLGFMARFAVMLVQMSLLVSIISALFMSIVMLFQGYVTGALLMLVFFAFSCCYALAVWRRIPFASANLCTALEAVKVNLGIVFVAYGLTALCYIWVVVWRLAVLGVHVKTGECRNQVCEDNTNPIVGILFLLSFFWSQQVIRNVLHCSVSGIVGTWWVSPSEASSTWSSSIQDSLIRSTTTSFGSICMGSLLVAVLQVLRTLVVNARRNNNADGIFMCILECVLNTLESLAEYFNKWAYVYVGLYGYSYLEAGKKVFTLFQERGWTTIINDDLVSGVLFVMSLIIGILTGCIGLVMAHAHKSWISEFPNDEQPMAAFMAAFFIGTALASILMNVVSSAVDTVVVLFAELPYEFQVNHAQLSQQMVAAWRKVYPDEFNFY